jgi:hypothetical protein
MSLRNGYLYLLSLSGFKYVEGGFTHNSHLDILDPVSLTQVGSYRLPKENPTFGQLVIVDHYAYISWGVFILSGSSGDMRSWLAVDISDPTNPVTAEIAYSPLDPQTATVVGKYAYVADGEAGLRILDISNPLDPTEVDAFGTYVWDVAVSNDYIYLANDSNGVDILRYNGQK